MEESGRLSAVLELIMVLDIDHSQVSNIHYNVRFSEKSQDT